MRNVSSWPLAEQHKYFAARFAFAHANELCERTEEVNGARVRLNWAQWFEYYFGQSLAAYQHQLSEIDNEPEQAPGEDRQPDSIAQ